MKIKLNMPLRGYPKGKVLDFSLPGHTCDRFWVNRIKDSAIDNCVSVITETKEHAKVDVKTTKKLRSKNVD